MKKNKPILFIVIFTITCIIFINFLTMHYATDTYNIINVGYLKYATSWSLRDGRLFMYIITMLAGVLKMNINIFVIGTLMLSLIISVISVIKLIDIIEMYKMPTNKLEKILIIIISYITIFNFMYLENLYFVESFVMSISILLLICAADSVVRNTKKGFIKNIIYVILAVFCYQGTIGFYLALVLLITMVKNKKNIKRVAIDLFECVITIGIAVGLNYIFVKTMVNIIGIQQTRLSSFSSIFSNLMYIKKNFNTIMTESVGLFPKYLQLIFLITTLLISITYLIYYKDENRVKNIIKLLLLTAIIIISGFITYLLSLSSFFTGRLRFSIGALLGLIYIYLYLTSNVFNDKFFKILITGIVCLYSTLTIYQYVAIIIDSKKVNQFEKIDVEEIANYISEYEKENNVEITKIAIGREKNQSNKTYYNSIKSKNILTYDALKCDWSVDGVIYFYSGIKLDKYYVSNIDELLNVDEEYKCIDDVLYIKVYNY